MLMLGASWIIFPKLLHQSPETEAGTTWGMTAFTWRHSPLRPWHQITDLYFVVVVQLLSHVWLFVTPWTAACQASLSFSIYWSLLRLMSTESVMPSNHLILCHPLLLLPSVFPSIRVISNESAVHIKWPKYWSFSFSISPSNKYSGLISFRVDWFDLLAVQGTLSSVLQHQSWKALILNLSLFTDRVWPPICKWQFED